MKEIVYNDGSIININGVNYLLKYVKGYGWCLRKIRYIKHITQ